MEYKKPMIELAVTKEYISAIEPIVAGIEEEGVLFNVEEGLRNEAFLLAKEASSRSTLDIGIGVAMGRVVVHIVDLKDQLLFTEAINSDEEILRKIGSNAARYVKRLPFK